MRALSALLVLLLSSCAGQPAFARDDGRYAQVDPLIKRWIEGLTDDQGRGCCASSDGFRPEEVEWDTAGNHYRVRINGAWFEVVDGAVIKGPNKLGFAMVWYYLDAGVVKIRCFLPGGGA